MIYRMHSTQTRHASCNLNIPLRALEAMMTGLTKLHTKLHTCLRATNKWGEPTASYKWTTVVEVHQDFMKLTHRCRGIYGTYCNLIKKNWKITTCKWLDLGTLGSWLIMLKIILCHWGLLCIQTKRYDHGNLRVLENHPKIVMWG